LAVSIVSTNSLSKSFGDKIALDKVTMDVQEGDLFGLFGPNGAGKTTLLRILTGQLEQDSGAAQVMGLDVKSDPMGVKRLIGIVPEVESPPTYLTAHEYLYFVAKVRAVQDIDKKIGRWLDFFDLQDAKNVICRDLSKGMRQKVMLASAFIHEPKLLFLDEPFINLDPIFQRKLREYLLSYVKSGGTVFMCSHLLEIAERLCDKAAIISEGRIVKVGAMSEIVVGERTLEDVFLRLVDKGE
jgi:ABC-2 type transport system ATP-binding protein